MRLVAGTKEADEQCSDSKNDPAMEAASFNAQVSTLPPWRQVQL